MSKQLDWDAYRYVLDDPTLDRMAFEARMLEDIDLALAVADAMLHIDSIRAASSIATLTSPTASVGSPAPVATRGWQLSSLAALAAALLLAVGILNLQVTHNNIITGWLNYPVTDQGLVESWLAIRQTELVDASSNLVDVSSNFESSRDEESSDGSESIDGDWLMDAAQEYFAQGEAG